jgi:putative ABC transport system permease protein
MSALVPAIKEAIWSVDNEQPIVRVARMETLLAESASERRFVLILFEAFGLVALALAGSGIYGVLSGSVTERTREIGVRSALGATRGGIVALIVRQGMTLTALGALLGVAGALLASQALGALLFGISRFVAFTYIAAIVLLSAVAAMACVLPAWRASRIDPMVALRYE